MKESTTHLQQRVRLLEDHNRTLLEFGQDCTKRLLKLEAQNGWEAPKEDFTAALEACASALGSAEHMVQTADSALQAAEGEGDAERAGDVPAPPSCEPEVSGARETAAAEGTSGVASLDHSTAVNYIYQVSLNYIYQVGLVDTPQCSYTALLVLSWFWA